MITAGVRASVANGFASLSSVVLVESGDGAPS
jgi:hypothetical protein